MTALTNQTLHLILTLTLALNSMQCSKHSTKYSHLSNVFRAGADWA